jgi:hypothetical protein
MGARTVCNTGASRNFFLYFRVELWFQQWYESSTGVFCGERELSRGVGCE